MHPLIHFASLIDNKVIQHTQSLFLKATSNKHQKYLSYIPILYYVFCYFGKRKQTFGEAVAMIKLSNAKLRLFVAITLQYLIVPKYPEFRQLLNQLNDIIYYICAIPGWFAIFNIQYYKTRQDLPSDSSNIFKYIGIASLVFNAVQYGKKLHLIMSSEETTLGTTCSLCLEPISNITCFPCGHTSCWNCAFGWIQKKRQCHVCRQPCEIQELIMLNAD